MRRILLPLALAFASTACASYQGYMYNKGYRDASYQLRNPKAPAYWHGVNQAYIELIKQLQAQVHEEMLTEDLGPRM